MPGVVSQIKKTKCQYIENKKDKRFMRALELMGENWTPGKIQVIVLIICFTKIVQYKINEIL